MRTTKQIESAIQPRIVRDRFGYPRIEQSTDEPRFAPLAVVCAIGAVVGAWVLAWMVSR